jgi:signal transduction histidine kinase
MLLPLRSGQRFVGALLLGTDVERFTAEQMDVLSTIAGYTMFAVQNLRLRNDLQDTRTGMMDRERDMRRQLNRDLHDGPAQALAAITLNLEFIKRLQQYEPARVQEELQKVIDMARRANHDVRTLLFELRSVTLETQGLVAAFQHYFERYADHPAKIVLEHGDVSMLDRNVQSTFLSLTQEAVNNAIKHAQATTIRVRVSHTVDQAMLRIEDDGIGFDLAAIRANYETRGSFGLLNIEERARLVNGTAELRSAPGHGTSIEVRVPLN